MQVESLSRLTDRTLRGDGAPRLDQGEGAQLQIPVSVLAELWVRALGRIRTLKGAFGSLVGDLGACTGRDCGQALSEEVSGKMIRRIDLRWILAGAVVLYVILFSVLSVVRYNTLHAKTFDLGILAQVTWNTAHGRWFETSVDRASSAELIGSYLGNHVRPILLLLAPLYRLWPDPRLLLVLQSVALGAAAFPLYAVARRGTGDARAALLIACCYLAYPAVGFLNLADFHPVAFTVPLLFLASWALLTERGWLFWVAVLLALSTKEEMVVPIGAWGMVSLLQRGKRRVGFGLMALAGVWAVLCFSFIIPHFNEGRPYRFWSLWSQLPGFSEQDGVGGGAGGASVATVALFLVHLFLPLGFLPFLGLRALVVCLPSLAYLLLGGRPALHSVGYQYPAVLIPWLFLAVVEGLRSVRPVTRRRFYRLGLAFLLVGTVGIQVALNPVYLYAQAGMFRPEPCHEQALEALAQIPPGAGVATINRLGPQVVNRRVLVAVEYPAPFRLDQVQMADFVLLDLVDCRFVPRPDPRAAYADMVEQVLETGQFRVRYWSGRILLLERGAPSEERVEDVLAYVGDLVEQDRPCWP